MAHHLDNRQLGDMGRTLGQHAMDVNMITEFKHTKMADQIV